jgi:hypothetical protein
MSPSSDDLYVSESCLSDVDITWTDDDGVTHSLPNVGEGSRMTRCGHFISVRVYDVRPVNCLACIGYISTYRPTISGPQLPNLQQIPAPKKAKKP